MNLSFDLGNFFDKECLSKFRNSPIFIILVFLSMIYGFFKVGYVTPESSATSSEINFYSNISPQGYIYIIICILILACLITNQIKNNILPKAGFKKLAVLFIIKADNKKDYDLLSKQLVERFDEIIRSSKSNINFQVLCVNYDLLNQKKYDLSDSDSCIKLLLKTNCIFSIQINIYSSKETRISEFELEVRTGVIHPTYTEEISRSFTKEMQECIKPLNNIAKVSKGQIKLLYNTAQCLTYTCKYIIGLMAMIEKDLKSSNIIFMELRESLIDEVACSQITNILLSSVNKHCYNLNIYLAHETYNLYEDTGNLSLLNDMENLLSAANEILPNTYDYHLENAIVCVLKYKDYDSAQKHIDACREQNLNGDWRYSDAFLFAYTSRNTWKIYNKYKSAFRYDTDISSVIYFIEKVIEEEPENYTLHLALGLLYEKTDNTKLMKYHFALFMHKSPNANPHTGINAVIINKIREAPCQEQCNQLCQNCVA